MKTPWKASLMESAYGKSFFTIVIFFVNFHNSQSTRGKTEAVVRRCSVKTVLSLRPGTLLKKRL